MKKTLCLTSGMLALLACTTVTSCNYSRQLGCAVGGAALRMTVDSMIDNHNKKAKPGKEINKAQRETLCALATVIGCIAGSELAGGVAEYTEKKREEYRSEAEYLSAEISGLESYIESADSQIAWLDEQSVKMRDAASQLKGQSEIERKMGSSLKDSSAKRLNDAKKLSANLETARKDARRAADSTTDSAKKAELRKQIAELDKRIERTKQVTRSIQKTNASIRYV